jgi:hypothetical protein
MSADSAEHDTETDDGERTYIVTRGPATDMHHLDGDCMESLSTRDGDCTFNARYRKVWETDQGMKMRKDVCGTHVPEEWLEVLAGERDADYTVVDLHAGCGKTVTKEVKSAAEIDAIPLGEQEVEPVEIPEDKRKESHVIEDCGQDSTIAFVGEGGLESAFCERHARDTWLSSFQSND